MTNLFLKALQRKYRFKTGKGLLNIEQLCELGKTELNTIYLDLESQIQTSKGLLGRKGNSEIREKLEIVKAIFDSIVEQEEKASKLAENAQLKERVHEALEDKEKKKLSKMTEKELVKMAKKL